MLQILAIVVSLAIAAVGVVLFVRAIRAMLAVVRTGAPTTRTDQPAARTVTLLKESLGHTRMLQWSIVGTAHWFVFIGFGLLFFTLLTAFGQLFDAHFALPLIGHFVLFEWASEIVTLIMIVAIAGFIVYRSNRPKERVRGPRGRFFGSTMWQGYFVESVILGVGLCIAILRGLEYALLSHGGEHAENASWVHFPVFWTLGEVFSGLSVHTIENLIYLVAMLKIVISFAWMITISLNITMGVAWHRFTAFFNIWLRREPDGKTALGALKPLTAGGKAITLDDLDDLDEDSSLGVGRAEEFAWKGILDFTTCTECGRCQSQCPAWNTEKPLSPKLLITALRDHTYAKAAGVEAEQERPLVGDTGDEWFYMPDDGSGVIDPDVLWSCTTCGACVQQCPVDIEHVDHIVDMRRYQILVESNFPSELNQLFKGLEGKGNPWNMTPSARMDWAKDLPFEVKVVGKDLDDLTSVDWLFWVGCAGAYEDRAKKTTRAVAELLDLAGVSFGVLGEGETCTGDPARRAGNEFVYQGLAAQNVETFTEYQVKKVVSTCAHCFNTLRNEYRAFGVELEVVHHTQLLNRLVREGRLTPISEGAGAAKRTITYHDPCYLGRHNQVYEPPRELLQVLPGAQVVEMERNSERSFCCGAGGARMWMEEQIGERINLNRTTEAVGTGADQIAVGCPFCRVMLSDGLTALQANQEAREEVEVLDVAQMLLASVKGEPATRVRKPAGAGRETAKAGSDVGADAASPAAGGGTATLVEEREQESTTAAAPAAPASGSSLFGDDSGSDSDSGSGSGSATAPAGGSLFGDPDDEPSAEAESEPAGGSLFDAGDDPEPAPKAGGSLFDTDEDAPAPAPTAEPTAGGSLFDVAEDPEPAPKAGGSLFDTDEDAPAPAPKAEPTAGGSLFDVADDKPAPAPTAAPKGEPEAQSGPATGSLFDVADDEPEPAPTPTPLSSSESSPAVEAAGTYSGSLFDVPDEGSDATASEPQQAQPEESETPTTQVEPEGEPAEDTAQESTEESTQEPKSLFDF